MKKTIFGAIMISALIATTSVSVRGSILKLAKNATAETIQNQELETPLIATNISQETNQASPNEILKAVPLDHTQAAEFLDIRGVGDSGMALTYQQPLKLTDKLPDGGVASFGQRLKTFDPTGQSYRGDLSFINWESVVGQYCNRFRGTPSRSSYAFVSHPDNISEAYQQGFNLISLANNHSWDCPGGENGTHGALVSALYMQKITEKISANWLWGGVGQPGQKATAQVKTMTIKGKTIRVAFGSLYLGGACTYITCVSDQSALLSSLRDADADIRILSIHSWNSSTQQQLVNTGKDFILNYQGDVVFGHGPHVWKPVTIVQSPSGKQGVMFESLGNFIHPNLAAKQKDMIGRALFDLETLELRQVQAIPLKVDAAVASFTGALSPTSIPANNLSWQLINDPAWQSGISPQVKGVYFNVKK